MTKAALISFGRLPRSMGLGPFSNIFVAVRSRQQSFLVIYSIMPVPVPSPLASVPLAHVSRVNTKQTPVSSLFTSTGKLSNCPHISWETLLCRVYSSQSLSHSQSVVSAVRQPVGSQQSSVKLAKSQRQELSGASPPWPCWTPPLAVGSWQLAVGSAANTQRARGARRALRTCVG